ncbi:hypothetical protein D3C80_1950040 [compost metagenome]
MHVQVRVAAGQLVQAVDDGLIRHRLVLGDPQQGFLPAHQGQGAPVQALALAQQFTGVLQQRGAVFGQLGLAAAAAFEQGYAQVRL